MTAETAIAKTETIDEQANPEGQNTIYYGRPIASNDIDNPEDLMGFLD